MAQGGSLIVPRWSIRVSLTTSCLSQSMYTLICDNLPFLVWILAHITVQAWASFRLEESVDFDAQIRKDEVFSLYEIVTPNTESGSEAICVCFRRDDTSTKRYMVWIFNVLERFDPGPWDEITPRIISHLKDLSTFEVFPPVWGCIFQSHDDSHIWQADGVKRNGQLRLNPFRIRFAIHGDDRL